MALNDPDTAAHAWARYRRLMWWAALVSALAAAAGVALLWWMEGPLPWLFLTFTAGGIFFTVLLAAVLMGLVFLSSGTGHDHDIQDLSEEENDDRFA